MGGVFQRCLGPIVHVAPGARVDRFEIYFDLAYVFSFFIIARAADVNLSPRGLLHAVLLLAVLWWGWVVHSLVANRIRLGEGFVPVVMVVAIVALYAFALASPQAFREPTEGISGPLLIAWSYLVIRVVHFAVYWYSIRHDRREVGQIRPYLFEMAGSVALLFAAALVPPRLGDPETGTLVREAIWIALVVGQYAVPLLVGAGGWVIASAEHWTERYDLILMIALGESLISIGVGSDVIGRPITWPTIAAAGLGTIGVSCLWWAHFDLIAPAARLTLHGTHGDARSRLARDAYHDIYLLMIVGIVLFALGGEELLQHVGGHHARLDEPLRGPGMPLLYGGTICYLVGNLLFQLRTLRTVTWTRVGTVLVLAALAPLAVHLPILVAFTLIVAIVVAMVIAEAFLFAGPRQVLRAAVLEERTAHEAYETAWRRPRTTDQPDEPTAGGPTDRDGGAPGDRTA